MGGTYSLPNPDYVFGKALPQSYDPPAPAELPDMELVEVPDNEGEKTQMIQNLQSALQNSEGLLKNLKQHVEINNLQEKTSEKNNLIYRDLVKKVQNQANKLIDSHEEYDTNLKVIKYTLNNSSVTKRNTNILLFGIFVFFILLALLIHFIRKKKVLPLLKNKALNNLSK